MLNRKCEKQIEEFIEKIENFLKKGDFNVRVTVIPKNKSRFMQKSLIDGAWRETFRDSIGGGIINDSKNLYSVECITKNEKINIEPYGNCIIDEIWQYVKDKDIVRINLYKKKNPSVVVENEPSVRSWIIIRD